jgi:hypothetical protein
MTPGHGYFTTFWLFPDSFHGIPYVLRFRFLLKIGVSIHIGNIKRMRIINGSKEYLTGDQPRPLLHEPLFARRTILTAHHVGFPP